MNLTTTPIDISHRAHVVRPEFIRLPKPGTSDPWTSLSRSTLNLLVLPGRDNGYCPPVRSCTLRRRGNLKGVRLIDLQSLLDYINSHVEPTYVEKKPEAAGAEHSQETAFVQKVELNESMRVILSVRVEKETQKAAQRANVPSQRLRDSVG